MPYVLLTVPAVQRQFDDLPPAIGAGLKEVLRALARDPKSKRFDLKKLAGTDARPPPLRLRVGDYRVILQIYHDLEEIRISRVGHRATVYRGWEGGD